MWHQTIAVGNLGSEPSLNYRSNGNVVCNFPLAVTEKWKDKQTKEKREKTTWYRVAVWGPQAENCNKWLKVGSTVMVIGNVEAQAYANNNGDPAASLSLTARDVRFLGGTTGHNDSNSQAARNTESKVPDTGEMPIPF